MTRKAWKDQFAVGLTLTSFRLVPKLASALEFMGVKAREKRKHMDLESLQLFEFSQCMCCAVDLGLLDLVP